MSDTEKSTTIPATRDALVQLQLHKFRQLVAYAAQHSPYYRWLIHERQIDPATCRPIDFPVLTKAGLVEHFDDIVTDRAITKRKVETFLDVSTDPTDLYDGKYVVFSSSGTSGQPAQVLYTLNEFFTGMGQVISTGIAVPGAGAKIKVAYVGAIHGHFGGVSMTNVLRLDADAHLYDLLRIDIHQPWHRIVETLNDFQPHGLFSYASGIRELADRKLSGELKIQPSYVRCGGEMLGMLDRNVIEGAFGVPLANVYASAECLYLGVSPAGDGMKLCEDNLIFELETDHIKVTNLYNYTVPIIRFRYDDVLVPQPLAPRDPLMTVNEIVGRTEIHLALQCDDGRMDSINAIALTVLQAKGLKRFQCVRKSPTFFTVRACLDQNLSKDETQAACDKIKNEIRGILDRKMMTKVTFDIEQTREIEVDAHSGKFKLIVLQS